MNLEKGLECLRWAGEEVTTEGMVTAAPEEGGGG